MRNNIKKAIQLITIIVIGILLVATVVAFARQSSERVFAAGPIPPPEGYPKLSLSTKVVTPTLAAPGATGAVLTYSLEIVNTGAYPATDVTLVDTIPNHTTYLSSKGTPPPVLAGGALRWEHGTVGFDTSVVINFSVQVEPGYEGLITNTAVIDDPAIANPVTVTAETRITDHPVFEISKKALPALPGKNKPLTYELAVTNVGQDADNTPVVVTDIVPDNTSFRSSDPDGTYDPNSNMVTWNRNVDLNFGESSTFTFSVNVGNVLSGTVINNDYYAVVGEGEVGVGGPYTTTVVDPIFILSKGIYPDPPGANREMTYTLTVLNLGSMATDLEINDRVPAGVEYRRGGDSYSGGVVTWHLDSLDTRESAQVTYTVYIADIANVIILNGDYEVCSAEIVDCTPGIPVPSLVVGPTFEVTAEVDPIAHKPGGGPGGKEEVTPTLTIRNLGPGNAIDANALLAFGNLSVSNEDVFTVKPPGNGAVQEGPACDIWSHCLYYTWTGDLNVGEVITITTIDPQSTIGGEEWTPYTATVVVTDVLGAYTTEPITATAVGHVTHMSNLIPIKSAPPQIGPGQTMTYTIQVVNSGLSTEEPPPPVLTETLPTSVTLVSISDGGTSDIVDGREVITWELPPLSPGDYLYRSFEVQVKPDLISGTQIINSDYATTAYESYLKGFKTIVGEPVTTTVHEVGLIDSYKVVTPTWALPGSGTVLTWTVHVANTGPNNLTGVEVTDIFPWQHSTYQRDAVGSVGTTSLISDIVSLEWTGNVAPYSEQLITFTTRVDDFFEGVLTNTATISHSSLKQDKVITAVAYITDEPVLHISKTATPDPVLVNTPLLYQIQVTNLGAQATLLEVTDTIPDNTSYKLGSASSGALVEADRVKWILPVLDPGESLKLTFQVTVLGGEVITNESYMVRCQEGAVDYGEPVTTRVRYNIRRMFLPLISKH